MARELLDLPTEFTWATDAGRTLSPSGTTPPLDPLVGHEDNQRFNPRVANYIHNLQGSWNKRFLIKYLGDFQDFTAFGGSTCQGVAKISTTERWIAVSGINSYYSHDGRNWIAGGAHGSASLNRNCSVNTTNRVIFADNSSLYYTLFGTTWSTAGSGAAHLANIRNNDFFLAARSNILEIWATGISGGSASPTTASWSPAVISGIAGDTANNWVLIDAAGNCHVSTDAADNWTQSGQGPIDAIASFVPRDVDYENGTIVCVGEDATTTQIAYSHDNGATWAAADMYPIRPSGVGVPLRSVRALGRGLWIAAGETQTRYNPMIWFSVDDGETWQNSSLNAISSDDLYQIWCDGTKILISGYVGKIAMTAPLAGLFT